MNPLHLVSRATVPCYRRCSDLLFASSASLTYWFLVSMRIFGLELIYRAIFLRDLGVFASTIMSKIIYYLVQLLNHREEVGHAHTYLVFRRSKLEDDSFSTTSVGC